MLQNDCITTMLEMEGFEITDMKNNGTSIQVTITPEHRAHNCPRCQALSTTVHDYRWQRVRDIPLHGKALVLMLRKRRYRCPNCGKQFLPPLPLIPRYHRSTARLTAWCLEQLQFKQSMKDIARQVRLSPSTIARYADLLSFHKPRRLSGVLAIDEFRGNTCEGKFQCILTNPSKHRVLDILPSRSSTALFEYFRSIPDRKHVRFFVMDMYKPYLELARTFFPQATVIIDRFHVARYNTWAFENVRRAEQKRLPAEQRRYFKRSRKLLLAPMHTLSPEDKQAVEVMLTLSPALREAYLLKENFYNFMHSPDSNTAKHRLTAFGLQASLADLPAYAPCLKMLKNWEPYILNAFDFPYSNGFTEGSNNLIKVIKRNAFGYRNFQRFRNRILHICAKT